MHNNCWVQLILELDTGSKTDWKFAMLNFVLLLVQEDTYYGFYITFFSHLLVVDILFLFLVVDILKDIYAHGLNE